ncbi:hypothetical protein AAY72_08995 [Alishewanella sp. WH16-1]|jgi:HTH-type transcriptional regulator, competence development regulator|uniref:helix-turn-helix domain-containing protein n=1 Tax=Alishewanella sp. WH16-1 TaxID=1651088 RepID=UPI0007097818|nr:helix-turn-helix transcriptional regulator [Alishewanella sp. WH16-1]KRS21216.1 hypothetical protein AAY72_08995 [Alishewanella sp. WH16-1]
MLTPFGKEVRKLRIDQGLSLKDMATAIGVSSAYISAVETGKKNITDELVLSICKILHIDAEQMQERMKELAEASKDKVSIDLDGRCEKRREVAAVFARNFDKFDSNDLDSFLNILRDKNR